MTLGPRVRSSPSARDADFDAGDCLADGAEATGVARCHGDYGRSFRQAVAGEQRQAVIGVPGFDVGRDGGAAAEQHFHVAAEGGAEGGGFVDDCRVANAFHHALVDERHGVESRWLHELAIAEQRFSAFGENEPGAADDPGVEVAGAGVDVAQWQDAEHRVVGMYLVGLADGGGVARRGCGG